MMIWRENKHHVCVALWCIWEYFYDSPHTVYRREDEGYFQFSRDSQWNVSQTKYLWHCSRFLLSLKANLYLHNAFSWQKYRMWETDTVKLGLGLIKRAFHPQYLLWGKWWFTLQPNWPMDDWLYDKLNYSRTILFCTAIYKINQLLFYDMTF